MNLPNKLTMLRIILIPVFLVLLLVESIPLHYLWSLIVYLAACFTDTLDGHLARSRNLVTDFGKLMDPLADKLLVMSALESGFAPKFVEENGEHSPGSSLFSYAFAPQGVPGVMNGLSTADFLWNIQCSVILQLAEKGPCVIVGRNMPSVSTISVLALM